MSAHPPLRAGLSALSLAFPPARTNDWWRERYPDLVARAEEATLSKVWTDAEGNDETRSFDDAMRPYLADPFRGTIERRVCGPDENSLILEKRAAQRALEASGRSASDIDLCLVASLRSEGIGVGNAAFLVRDLGLRCPAWNYESACSSALVGLSTAASMITAGPFRSVLVVVSCTYCRDVDMSDSFSWFLGDGAAAFVVEERTDRGRVLGYAAIPTETTCGAFAYHLLDGERGPGVEIRSDRAAGKELRRTAEPFLRETVHRALEDAGVGLEDIGAFVFNTPTAWYADFCGRALGLADKSIASTYSQYANIGPVLNPANLHATARAGHLHDGDLVLAYAVGSVSTATAVVFEWRDVAVHPNTD